MKVRCIHNHDRRFDYGHIYEAKQHDANNIVITDHFGDKYIRAKEFFEVIEEVEQKFLPIRFFCRDYGKEIWQEALESKMNYTIAELWGIVICSDCLLDKLRK